MPKITQLTVDPRPVATQVERRVREMRLIAERGEAVICIYYPEERYLDASGNVLGTPTPKDHGRRDFTAAFLAANPGAIPVLNSIAAALDAWDAEDEAARIAKG